MATFAELWGISKVFPSYWIEQCVLSSYYKVFYILFIYLVGRAYIPGIFGWFVLLGFFFPLKEARPPCRNISLGDKAAVVNLPKSSLLGALPQFLQKQELVSGSQDFPGKSIPVSEYSG